MAETKTLRFLRFSLGVRFEHWFLVFSFTLLALTGLIQKYAGASISQSLITFMGGIEMVRILHRIGATMLMLEVVYHLGVAGYRLFVKRVKLSMLLSTLDIRAAFQALKYNLGFKNPPPKHDRYSFEEKIEYWAVVWGMVIMGVTGFMLWNPISTTRLLPGQYIPAAKSAHSNEALLAVLAIIIWHFYNVLVRHFNKSMFFGYLSREEMQEFHPLELTEIESGIPRRTGTQNEVKKRRKLFLSAYTLVSAVLLVGIYQFITFEQTALATIPTNQQVPVYAPLTPTPYPTPLPTIAAVTNTWESWDTGISDIFELLCGSCHSDKRQKGGLNLGNYDALLAGGDSGPAITPGDAAHSLLVKIQEEGGHPGQFTEEELAFLRAWIDAGAP
ncbi:MAG: cytochrome b/b6 domain-containing protein [Chloroflexota bacterium]